MGDNIFFNKSDLKYCGKDVIIGKTVRIRKPGECIIDDGTIIDDFTYISCPIEIGKNCHIASHVSISGGLGKFTMGDYSTISNHVSIHCASSDYSNVSLDLPSIPKKLQFGGEVTDITLGDFVTIGAHSCLLPNTIAKDGSACGSFSLVNGVMDEWSLYVGIPYRFIKKRDNTELLNNGVK